MPTPNPSLRREYKGAAAATALQNSISNTDISFVLVAANNWPTGSVGKFVITINRGLADEEKILCDSQTSRTVACLLANRGFDGTTPQSHAAGATVECTISAFDADEWNQHTNATAGVHGAAGTVVGTTDAQTLTNKTLTSPTVNSPTVNSPTVTGGTLDATSTLGGVSGTSLAADRAAWTAWSPAVTQGGTTPAATVNVARYRQTGKYMVAVFGVTVNGSGTGTSTITVSGLPVAFQQTAATLVVGTFVYVHAGTYYTGAAIPSAATTAQFVTNANTTQFPAGGFTMTAGDVITGELIYETA